MISRAHFSHGSNSCRDYFSLSLLRLYSIQRVRSWSCWSRAGPSEIYSCRPTWVSAIDLPLVFLVMFTPGQVGECAALWKLLDADYYVNRLNKWIIMCYPHMAADDLPFENCVHRKDIRKFVMWLNMPKLPKISLDSAQKSNMLSTCMFLWWMTDSSHGWFWDSFFCWTGNDLLRFELNNMK